MECLAAAALRRRCRVLQEPPSVVKIARADCESVQLLRERDRSKQLISYGTYTFTCYHALYNFHHLSLCSGQCDKALTPTPPENWALADFDDEGSMAYITIRRKTCVCHGLNHHHLRRSSVKA